MISCLKITAIRKILFVTVVRKIMFGFYCFNYLIPKKNNEIVGFVDYEKVNGILIPYKNDNVFIMCQYIKRKNNNINITFIRSNQFGGTKNKNIIKNKILYFWKQARARVILCKQPPSMNNFYNKSQYLICLGYFIPFKSDFFDIKRIEISYPQFFKENICAKKHKRTIKLFIESERYKKAIFDRTNFTYITASKFASRVIARSHGLPISSFLELGSPKSDIESHRSADIKRIFNLPSSITHILLYCPTYRDIYKHSTLSDIPKIANRIFGYEKEDQLGDFLIKNNIVIIIKLHKSFSFYRELEKYRSREGSLSYIDNCYFLDFEIEARENISIHDLFSQSDAMIADYSSISFDYLSYDKPIVYNIPDIEEYRQYRGFSYEPIENMMPGDKVSNLDEFKESLFKIASNKDSYKKERSKVLSVVNEVPKGKSQENIYKHIIHCFE